MRHVWIFIAIALSFFLGWILSKNFSLSSTSNAYPIRNADESRPLINPLIGVEVGDKKDFSEYEPLLGKIQSVVNLFKRTSKIISASVYYRDVNSGHWTGIDENEKYAPASLYKVVLMIAILKKAEDEPNLLEKEIFFNRSIEKEKPDHEPLEPQKKYKVRELIDRLIIFSDNDAKNLLHTVVPLDAVWNVFTDLGLTPPRADEIGDSMSAKDFSRFFRILYSATYLNRDMSQYALQVLSKTEFKQGLRGGMSDKDIIIAHKFGHRRFDAPIEKGVTEELHDCGIIYDEKKPYFLCVMTKGENPVHLSEFIQEISRSVYLNRVK